MKLTSARSLENLRPVLLNPQAEGPDPVYQVFSLETADGQDSNWANQTVLVPGLIGQEYTKTFGHYHPDDSPVETYKLTTGEGVLVLHKKDLSVVYLVKAEVGDEIKITNQFGHAWSNVGQVPLISFDDWRDGHSPGDYDQIKEKQGMAYYLVAEGDQVKVVANSHYQNLPEPIWTTPAEFARLSE